MATINKQPQNKALNAILANPTPCLRSLVIDYLCHSCYSRTARAFAKDSTVRHLDADGDEIIPAADDSDSVLLSEASLKLVELREEIRREILSGRVDNATDLLNKYFPSVLAESDQNRYSSDVPATPTRSAANNMEYVSHTSVEPLHLSLNLRILAFSEACRTRPLEMPSRRDVDMEPSGADKLVADEEDLIDVDEFDDDDDDDDDDGDEMYDSMEQPTAALLSRAQKLYALASSLPDPVDRATYLKELENVGGLLAYRVPETSSISKYLTMERREAVADQVNRAILHRTGNPVISSIELIARYTDVLWRSAHLSGVKARPGVLLPPTITKSSEPTKATENNEVVPVFDLQQFLDLK